MSTKKRKFFFNHIYKSGGSALNSVFQSMFGAADVIQLVGTKRHVTNTLNIE